MDYPVDEVSNSFKSNHDLEDVADCLYNYLFLDEIEVLQVVLIDSNKRDKLIQCIDYLSTDHPNESDPFDADTFELASSIIEEVSSDFIEVLKEVLMSDSDSSTVSSLLAAIVFDDFSEDSNPIEEYSDDSN